MLFIYLMKLTSESQMQIFFEFVLKENNTTADASLFIDDTKENTDAASQLGIKVWNIDETKEDVTTLFKTLSHLF